MPPPTLTRLDKDRAKATEPVTLTGTDFSAATEDSAVHFRLPPAGSPDIAATVLEWKADAVRVEVPPLESFGSGGPLLVRLTSAEGQTGELDFLLLEDEKPSITRVVRPPRSEEDPEVTDRGLEDDEIVITGDRFGRPSSQSGVAFTAPGPRLVAAHVLTWTPTELRVRVPTLVDLGGAGSRPIVVRTAWGDSDAHAFLVGELPTITGLNPDQARPGGVVVIHGHAFGEEPGQVTLVPLFSEDAGEFADRFIVAPTLGPAEDPWQPDAIVVTLPGRAEFGASGEKNVFVTTEWGQSEPQRLLIESRASVTVWHRLEPHPRTDDLQQGLRLGTEAAVDDAAWMLGRQWQMFEFHGEDAGSPVSVRIEGGSYPFARWHPGTADDASVPPGTPLETLVERERVLPAMGQPDAVIADLRLAAELGLQFLRNLGARLNDPRKLDDYRKRFLAEYGIAPPAGAVLDAESRRFMALATGRALDGGRLYADLQVALGPNPSLPKKPPIDGNDRAAALAAIRDWYDWCASLFSEPPGDQPSPWDSRRMEYRFAVSAGDAVLDCPEHDGGHLDWYSFSRSTATAGDDGVAGFVRTALPSLVTYPGMPAARWWEIEDATVDFGAVSVGASELLTLLFVEFGLAYGNDWFVVPVEGLVPGSVCRINAVEATDSFGRTTVLAPFGDGKGSDWRMFELAQSGTSDAGDTMVIPDALPTTLASKPIEEVLFLRDELANLAWAVERVVEGRTGRPLDRHQDEQDRRRQAELTGGAAAANGGNGPLSYVLQTLPPPNWYPLIPREGAGVLSRGALRENGTGPTIPPAGQLLEPGPPPPPLDIFDEEVPRSGLRVVREWQLGRAPDGSTHLWRTRRKTPGRGEGSSGLRFDRIERS